MDWARVLLIVHIAAAGTWLGGNIIQAVVPPLAARQGTAVAAGWYRVSAVLSARFYMPAAILILLSGVTMVLIRDEISFADTFVSIGIGMVIIGALLGKFVFDPGGRAAAEEIESGDQTPIRSAVGRLAAFGTIDTLLLLFTFTAMVFRWQ
ncbi:MAG: hypothetical protein ACE5F5_04910 [Acidimicrobiia bacterium]